MTKKKAVKKVVKKAEPKVDPLQSEFDDLVDKIEKLSDFMHGTEFKTLDQNQRVLLSVQLNAMRSYGDALALRINS